MIMKPITLSINEVHTLTKGKSDIYFYESDSCFITTKQELLKCDLSESDKSVISQFSDNEKIKIKNVQLGIFTIEL